MSTWQLQEAKSKFSEVVVLISRAEYARLTHPKPGFVEFMRRSPMAGLELDTGRHAGLTREIAL